MNPNFTTKLMTTKFFFTARFVTAVLGSAIFLGSLRAADKVLILSESVYGGLSSVEATAASNLGYEVELVDGAAWRAKSQADFRTYRALILGDPNCSGDIGVIDAAEDTRTTWGPIVDGNIVVIGTDPIVHPDEGVTLTQNGVAFAVQRAGKTGLYISLSCYYGTAAPETPVPVLEPFGTFKIRGGNCHNAVHVVNTAHSVMANLDDAALSGWGCSIHEAFDVWPRNFEVIAMGAGLGNSFTADDQTVGSPYILVGPGRPRVLFLDTALTAGSSSPEVTAAESLGFDAEIVTSAEWQAKSGHQFSTYRALVLGDPNSSDIGLINAAEITKSTWGPRINGNVIAMGADPAGHGNAGAITLINKSIAFVTAQPESTGFYLCLSEYFGNSTPIRITVMDPFVTDEARFFSAMVAGCNDRGHIVATHPALEGLTDADISDWGCSVHETINQWDPSFQVLAIDRDQGAVFIGPDGIAGTPYIVARGQGLRPIRAYLSLAIDANDDVWVSGLGRHQKVDVAGSTATPVAESLFETPDWGGHGNLVDKQGRIWSTRPGMGIVRFEDNPSAPNRVNFPMTTFGDANIGLDPNSGSVWTTPNGDPIFKILSDTSAAKYQFSVPDVFTFPKVSGLAVDNRNNIWLAIPDAVNRVAHLRTDGTLLGWVMLPCNASPVNDGPKGIAVDANGRVWTPDFTSGKIFRINPDLGPIVFEQQLSDGSKRSQPLGAVDLTVDLGLGAAPDNYSDMAGSVTASIRSPSGSWNAVHDGGSSRTWRKVAWTEVLPRPANTSLEVAIRAAASHGALQDQDYTIIDPSGATFTPISGQYLEVRVTMTRNSGAAPDATPVLKDLTVTSSATVPGAPADVPSLAEPDFIGVARNTPKTLEVMVNDPLTGLAPALAQIISLGSAQFGRVAISDNTNVIYTPNPDFYGEDRFTYTISDGRGASDLATVNITVSRIDPQIVAPSAHPDIATVNGNSHVVISVLANDCYQGVPPENCAVDRDKIILLSVGQPTRGITYITNCNQVAYVPSPYYVGTDTFVYFISNGDAEPAVGTVTVTVTGDPPANLACGSPVVNRDLTDTDMKLLGEPGFFSDTFRVTATAGKLVQLTLNNAGFNPRLVLRSAAGAFIAAIPDDIDPPPGNSDAYLEFRPLQTASYILDVTSSSPGQMGSYTLSMVCQDMWVKSDTRGLQANDVLDFGVLTYPETAEFPITIGNDGSSTLIVRNLNTFSSEFVIEPAPPAEISINAGGTYTFTVKYQPSNPSSPRQDSGTLQFEPDALPLFYVNLRGRVNPELVEPPTVFIFAPLNHSTLPSPVIVQIGAHAESPAGWDLVQTEFFFMRPEENIWRSIAIIPAPPFVSEDHPGLSWNNGNPAGVTDGDYFLTAVVTDEWGQWGQAEPVLIRVRTEAPPNDPPTAVPDEITVPPDSTAVPLLVLPNDSDPDGDPLTITRYTQAFFGTIALVNNQLLYTPNPGFIGFDAIRYEITDQRGGYADTIVDITVPDIYKPTITITAPSGGAIFQLPQPSGITINATATLGGSGTITKVKFYVNRQLIGEDTTATGGNQYSFNWANPYPGEHVLNAVVYTSSHDPAVSEGVNISVMDINRPTVQITSPANAASFNLPVTAPPGIVVNATATALDGATITKIKFYANNTLIGEDATPSGGVYSFNWTLLGPGNPVLRAVAFDSNDRFGVSAPIDVNLVEKSGPNNEPIAQIVCPAEYNSIAELGTKVVPRIAADRLLVRGLAHDTADNEDVTYQLLISDVDGNIVVRGDIVTGDGVSTGPNGSCHDPNVTGGELGVLDLTSIPNGRYNINLMVSDQTSLVFAEPVCILLQSEAKIGHFSFSQEDLLVPVNGIPLRVIRTYNSKNLVSGDFGVSWTYSMADMEIELDEVRRDVLDDEGEKFSLRVGGGRNVSLTLPNGKRATFVFDPLNHSYSYTPRWIPSRGVTASLTANDRFGFPLTRIQKSWPNPYWDYSGASSRTPFVNQDIPGFTLTTQDGTSYVIAREDLQSRFLDPESAMDEEGGGLGADELNIDVRPFGPPYLSEIRHRSGNVTKFIRGEPGADGKPVLRSIEHWNPADVKTVSLAFQRDSQGRIEKIYDPVGLSEGLDERGEPVARPVLQYEYDPAGNLWRVLKLKDREATEASYQITEFRYENPEFPNYITKILNDSGPPIATTFYDDEGRVDYVVDVRGFTNRFDRTVVPTFGVGAEKAVDQWGNATITEYDANGNVVLSVNAMNQKVHSTFDDDRQLTSRETLDPDNTLVSREEYTIDYFPGSSKVQRRTLRQKQVVNGTIVVGSHIVTIREFNQLGQLVKATDPKGKYTVYSYDQFGKMESAQAFDSNDNPVYASAVNTEHTSGPFKGLVNYSEDPLGTKVLNLYYDGTEPGSGGAAGKLRQVEQRDAQDNLLSLQSFTYDANGNLLTVSRARNNATDLQVTESVYNALGLVERTVDAELGESTSVFGQDGQVSSVTDRYGNAIFHLYNRNGEPVQTTYPDGSISRSTTIYGYGSNEKGRATVVEQPHFPADPAYGTRTEYNELGQAIKVERLKNFRIAIVPDGSSYSSAFEELTGGAVVVSSTSTEYDSAGREEASIDARGNTTSYTYDGYGRRETTTTWVTTPTARERTVATPQYDDNGNVAHTVIAVTKFTLTEPPTQIGDSVIVPTPTFQYDALNRRWLTIHQDNSYSRSIYDALGRKVEEIDRDGISTRFDFDGAGRLVTVTKPYKIYDPNDLNDYDNPTVVDANPADQTITRYKYNLSGSLVQVTDANQTVVSPEIDQKHTTFEYDRLGRQTKRKLPQNQEETWTYDEIVEGQLKQRIFHTDFNQTLILHKFDSRGRLTEMVPTSATLPPEARVPTFFTYTATGQRRTMTDASGNTTYLYDDDDRLQRKSVRVGSAPNYEFAYDAHCLYDAAGNLTQTRLSRGETETYSITHAWDELNRLQKVFSTATPSENTSYAYDLAGNLSQVTYPNEVITSYNYNSVNHLRYLAIEDGGFPLASFDYDDYDTADQLSWPLERRLTRVGQRRGAAELIIYDGQEHRRLAAYDYDSLGRIRAERMRTGVAWPAWPATALPATPAAGDILYDLTPGYTDLPTRGYDRVGNRHSRAVSDAALIAKGITDFSGQLFNANDRLSGGINDYDANGNTRVGDLLDLDGVVSPTAANKDVYDYQNRLIKRSDGTKTVTLVYDGDGGRVRKSVLYNGITTTTRYVMDDRNPTGYRQVLEEWLSVNGNSPSLLRTYIYGHDLISQRQSDGTEHYYGYDGHGSVRLLIADEGIVSDAYSYDAFGIVVDEWHQSPGTPTPNNYLYSGEQWDPELGMYFLRARYLNPQAGRFWTMDSFEGLNEDPLSLHKYLYANADPVNRVDPSGHFGIVVAAMSMAADVIRYALQPGRTFEASEGLSFAVDEEQLANADEDTLIEMHVASQEWLLLHVNSELRRGVAEMSDAQDAMWDAFFAVWDFNEEVIWDLIEGVSYVRACFAAGTPIVVGVNPDGSYVTRPIEDLRPDDSVLALNERDPRSEAAVQHVTQVYSREVDHLRFLTIRSQSGTESTIRTTDEHPIWTADRGWTPARELQTNDYLLDASGAPSVLVTCNERQALSCPIRVYNLEVDTDHTYFVADLLGSGTLTIWVHNGCVKPNLNSNNAKSKYGIYEIRNPDGSLHKIGKADLNRITQSTGSPTRLHQQLRKLNKNRPAGSQFTGKVVDDLGETTTKAAKNRETARLQDFYKKHKYVPKGNEKSFFPQ